MKAQLVPFTFKLEADVSSIGEGYDRKQNTKH
ncbi:Uncharacterised protein [Legionella gratiana]|uniref:Uncharacterized protein n=1 Tax=Legionella gratiana TaxID=45066 RepID=A0A378JE61_9GAMM|nr:Uncharacterised protein [Legionella gratiana]